MNFTRGENGRRKESLPENLYGQENDPGWPHGFSPLRAALTPARRRARTPGPRQHQSQALPATGSCTRVPGTCCGLWLSRSHGGGRGVLRPLLSVEVSLPRKVGVPPRGRPLTSLLPMGFPVGHEGGTAVSEARPSLLSCCPFREQPALAASMNLPKGSMWRSVAPGRNL